MEGFQWHRHKGRDTGRHDGRCDGRYDGPTWRTACVGLYRVLPLPGDWKCKKMQDQRRWRANVELNRNSVHRRRTTTILRLALHRSICVSRWSLFTGNCSGCFGTVATNQLRSLSAALRRRLTRLKSFRAVSFLRSDFTQQRINLCCVPLKSWSRDHEFTSGETAFHSSREVVNS